MPEISSPGEILAEYPACFRPSHIDSQAAPRGFSGAEIVRIETPSGTFCLRGWPADAPPAARILGVHRLLRHVFERGVCQVAVPERALDGKTLVDVRGRLWQIEPWMPGRADFRDNPSDIRLRNAMRCLAAWHNAAAAFQPDSTEARWFESRAGAPSPAVVERRDLLRVWTGGRLAQLQAALSHAPCDDFHNLGERAVRVFEETSGHLNVQLETAVRLDFPIQPCLRDVWHDHILFTGDEVTGLIDPSACRSDNVSVDLARLLGSLVGNDRRRWEIAIEDYSRHRPLSISELGLTHLLDASGLLLSVLRWLDRHFLEREGFAEPHRVLARLRDMLVRLKSLRE